MAEKDSDEEKDLDEVFKVLLNYPDFNGRGFILITVPTLTNLIRICDSLDAFIARMFTVSTPLSGITKIPLPSPDKTSNTPAERYKVPHIPRTEKAFVQFKKRTYARLVFPAGNDDSINAEIFNAGYNDYIITMFLANVDQTHLIYRKATRVMRLAMAIANVMIKKCEKSETKRGSSPAARHQPFSPSQKSPCPRNLRKEFTYPSPQKFSCPGKSPNKSLKKFPKTKKDDDGANTSTGWTCANCKEVSESNKKYQAEGGTTCSGEEASAVDRAATAAYTEELVKFLLIEPSWSEVTQSPQKSQCPRKSPNKSTPTQQKIPKTIEEYEGAKASGSTSKNSISTCANWSDRVPESDKKDQAEGAEENVEAGVVAFSEETFQLLLSSPCWAEWRAIMILNLCSCQMLALKKKEYLERLIQYCLQQDAPKLKHVGAFGKSAAKIGNNPLPQCDIKWMHFPQTKDALTGVRSLMLDLIEPRASWKPKSPIIVAAAPEPTGTRSNVAASAQRGAAGPARVPALPTLPPTPVETDQASGGRKPKNRKLPTRPDSLIKPFLKKKPPAEIKSGNLSLGSSGALSPVVKSPCRAAAVAPIVYVPAGTPESVLWRRLELVTETRSMLEVFRGAVHGLRERVESENVDIIEGMRRLTLEDEEPTSPKDESPKKKPSKKKIKNQKKDEKRKKK